MPAHTTDRLLQGWNAGTLVLLLPTAAATAHCCDYYPSPRRCVQLAQCHDTYLPPLDYPSNDTHVQRLIRLLDPLQRAPQSSESG